jgi:uncharacterized membrane protein YidH (DUF202 family)
VILFWSLFLAYGNTNFDGNALLCLFGFLCIGHASLFYFLLSKFVFKNTDVSKFNIWLMCIVITIILCLLIFVFIIVPGIAEAGL